MILCTVQMKIHKDALRFMAIVQVYVAGIGNFQRELNILLIKYTPTCNKEGKLYCSSINITDEKG